MLKLFLLFGVASAELLNGNKIIESDFKIENATKGIGYQSAACYDQFNGFGSIFNVHDPINDLRNSEKK